MSVVLPEISRDGSSSSFGGSRSAMSHPDAIQGKRKPAKKVVKAGDPKAMTAGAEIARALANIGNSSKTAAQVAEIQDMQDDVSRKLDKAVDRDRTLAMSLVEMSKTLEKAKKSRDGVYGIQTGTAAITKEIKNLEKRLDKARSNFNLAVDENNKLRANIDTARHELEAGDHMLKVEMKALTVKQLQLRDLTEGMQTSYCNRDRAQVTMQELKDEAHEAEHGFRHQWARLQRVMEEDAQRSHAEKRTKLKSKGDRMAEVRYPHRMPVYARSKNGVAGRATDYGCAGYGQG
jgi:chromosome segregation ATPase